MKRVGARLPVSWEASCLSGFFTDIDDVDQVMARAWSEMDTVRAIC